MIEFLKEVWNVQRLVFLQKDYYIALLIFSMSIMGSIFIGWSFFFMTSFIFYVLVPVGTVYFGNLKIKNTEDYEL